MTEQIQDVPQSGTQPSDDTRIVIILDGRSATPKAVDFYKATPFQMMAVGEWLLLKAKQMITSAEQRELEKIAIAQMAPPDNSQIIRASK